MMDFNHRPNLSEQLGALIDCALQQERAQQSRRNYLGASRLGVSCNRALQFEFADAPVDPGRETPGRTLRIFEVGHVLEDLAVRWLRLAGIELLTRDSQGEQFGFSVCEGRIQGHIDGIVVAAPEFLGWSFPMLWESKSMNAQHWRDCVKHGVTVSKPVYAAQVATYQAYMAGEFEGLAHQPCLFTAINKDTQEIHFELLPFDPVLAQSVSDRAVRILEATAHGELLPRSFQDPTHFECRFCAWAERCWRTET